MSVLASIVDGEALLQVVYVGIGAGVGVTAAYGLALLGVTRATEFSRDGRTAQAVVYGALGVAGLAVVVAAVVFGIVVMTHK